MQVLENFLVGIGFKVDEKGSKDAQGVFDNLTRSALQFGAVVAGKFALDKVIGVHHAVFHLIVSNHHGELMKKHFLNGVTNYGKSRRRINKN